MNIPTLSVNQAIDLCNRLLDDVVLRVEGEVSEYTLSRGKFVFFELKDETVEGRLACFAMAHQLSTPLENGMRVVVEGTPGLYTKSGKFRLSVLRVNVHGEGSLQRAFSLLLAKLEREGLFAPTRKRLLPAYVERIGLISSSGAAGYGDFIKVAESRRPGLHITFVNVAVQGQDAERELCAALDYLNGQPNLEAIVIVRGGGSLDDLHAFNSESVARAIVRSRLPVVVGVGHERDVTIADYCADVRAATPSNAAEILVCTAQELRAKVVAVQVLAERRLATHVASLSEQVVSRAKSLHTSLLQRAEQQKERVEVLTQHITSLAPQATLQRGYTVTVGRDGVAIRSRVGVDVGTHLVTHFADGSLNSTVS